MDLWKALSIDRPAAAPVSTPSREPPPKPAKSKPLARMSDAELRAHYRATAPLEDVRFAIRTGVDLGRLDGRWHALADAVARGVLTNRAEIYAELRALQDEWRLDRESAERAARRPVRQFIEGLRLPGKRRPAFPKTKAS
jgi:hypothetical protein